MGLLKLAFAAAQRRVRDSATGRVSVHHDHNPLWLKIGPVSSTSIESRLYKDVRTACPATSWSRPASRTTAASPDRTSTNAHQREARCSSPVVATAGRRRWA